MTTAVVGDARTGDAVAGAMALAAAGSLGAGIVHAAAIGVHAEHRAAVVTFTVVTFVQVGWAVLALVAPRRAVAVIGVVLGAAAAAGWVVAKTAGIPFVAGLDEPEAVQFADAVAAALAALSALAALGAIRTGRSPAIEGASRSPVVGLAMLGVFLVATPAVVSASEHRHAGGEAAHDDAPHDGTGSPAEPAPAVVPPKPYDPRLPIDLSGVEGVTPEQQAKAENLIAVTLLRLPKFTDPAAAEAAGYRTIGDAVTGYEHFVNWSLIDDGRVLDPDYPESLVYRVQGGQRVLEAAMYMLPRGTTLEDVPTDVGGPLVQWHVHDNLCFTPDPEAPRVLGLTQADGTCRPPLVKGTQVPMVHVWIVPHPCGPFAALEGVGAGQIKPGEQRLCDHAHGSRA